MSNELTRYLGEDFNPDDVSRLPDSECEYCGRQAATGEYGNCRWCRGYLHGVAGALDGGGEDNK